MRRKKLSVVGLLLLLGLFSCRQVDPTLPPVITFDEQEYTVKTERLLKITPTIKYDNEFAAYSWSREGQVISREKELVFSAENTGTYYVTFQVVTPDGTARREVKISVVDLDLPIISIDGGNDLIIETGEQLTLVPKVKNDEELKYKWLEGGEVVSEEAQYIFSKDEDGVYFLSLEATNADGVDKYDVRITVMKSVPLQVSFPYETQSATVGRLMRIIPTLPSKRNVTFQWFVNGIEDKAQTKDYYSFTPTGTGTTEIRVVATKSKSTSTKDLEGTRAAEDEKLVGEATVVVQASEPNQHFRAAAAGNSPFATNVFEYLPAPGQFINEGTSMYTMKEANDFARKRFESNVYVSLGGFGGYVVVGFDHSVRNTKKGLGYDFAIMGNSFASSSEPGIVWVMQDENGNGIPDDNWYELKGSETGKPGTIQDYEITYYRPSSAKTDVQWTDNQGNRGTVDWLTFHQQDSYYPLWVPTDSYTLRGTRLDFVPYDKSGNGSFWVNPEFEWGYADNFSPIDRLTEDDNYNAAPNANHFKIEHAIDHEGNPVQLDYIDFVKVQTGANAKAGWLGENSTEVFQIIDIQIPQ